MLNRLSTIVTMRDGTMNIGRIEGDVRPGLPGITLIGFTGDVRAARDRVQDVFTALGMRLPQRRMVIHAVPAAAPMPADLYAPMIAAVLAGCINHDFRGRDIIAVPEQLAGPDADELVRIGGGQGVNVPEHNDAEAVVALVQSAAARIGKTPF